MQEFRFFAADPSGPTHKALSDMERAGTEIVNAFKILDGFSSKATLIAISAGNRIVGLSLLPGAEAGPEAPSPELARTLLKESFQNVAHQTLRADVFMMSIPDFLDSEMNAREEIERATRIIGENVLELGLNPNIAVSLALNLPRGAARTPPEKAVLTVNDRSFYPEAHLVFTTWVVRLPAYIELQGNDYVPPDCVALTPEQVASMVSPMSYDMFRHDHAAARDRLLRLPRLDAVDPK